MKMRDDRFGDRTRREARRRTKEGLSSLSYPFPLASQETWSRNLNSEITAGRLAVLCAAEPSAAQNFRREREAAG
jgi:hypothetical protein